MSRANFNAFLEGQGGTTVLLPLTEYLASRVGSDSLEDMMADPALWGGHLARTARLVESDAVFVGFDLGASGDVTADDPRLLNAMEAVDRLRQTEGSWLGTIGVVAGPVSLVAAHGEEAGRQLAIDMAEAYCRKRPDLLLFREGQALGQSEIGMSERKLYNTLRNMASYYSVPLAIHIEGYDQALIADLPKLLIGHVFLGIDQQGNVPDAGALAELAGELAGIAVSLPDDADSFGKARDLRAAIGDVALAFTSSGNIDKDADLAVLRTLWERLRTVG